MNDIMIKLEALGAEPQDALERFLDDETMYTKYICQFPEEPTMARLVKAVDNKDYQEAKAAVHALKGIVNNLGFLPLVDASVDMLEELRAENIEDALEAYADLCYEYDRFTKKIIAWREKDKK